MKTKELIELLSKLPEDTEVVISDTNGEESLKPEHLEYIKGQGVFVFDVDGFYSVDVSIETLMEKEI